MKTIRVLLAGGDTEVRSNLLNILESDHDIDVIGETGQAWTNSWKCCSPLIRKY